MKVKCMWVYNILQKEERPTKNSALKILINIKIIWPEFIICVTADSDVKDTHF